MDIVLSSQEAERMRLGEMINYYTCFNGRKFYIGTRIDVGDEYEEEFSWPEQDPSGYD